MRNNELPPDNWTAHYLGYYWETDHPENRVSVASLHRPIFVAKREGQSLGITDSISNPSHRSNNTRWQSSLFYTLYQLMKEDPSLEHHTLFFESRAHFTLPIRSLS
ncbi:hypothetical protein V6N12_057958 [Hibiscus sabdariffa]|uniref:Uncharacterized protein n=1 Tax=Hibiscus sabdariffa TaxID=183260 RepID=A0ABR2AEJ6_9ROSI